MRCGTNLRSGGRSAHSHKLSFVTNRSCAIRSSDHGPPVYAAGARLFDGMGESLVIGVIVVGHIATPANRQTMINAALFFAGAVLLVFALIEPATRWIYSLAHKQPPAMLMLVLLGVMTFLLGLLNSFIGVPAQTALQERSPEDIRARVFSVFFTVSNIILIVPVFFAGALADSLGYPQTVALISLVVISIAGIGLYRIFKERNEPKLPPTTGKTTAEEMESALTAAAPGAQPLPTIAQRGKQTE